MNTTWIHRLGYVHAMPIVQSCDHIGVLNVEAPAAEYHTEAFRGS
jgi:hypothetical protein